METSTPAPNIDIRRKTLLKNTVNVSPLRRSLVLHVSLNRSSILEVSNDDNERSDRRNQLEIQKRLSNLPQGRAPLNESFVKEQFMICTHLFTENKITTKNAWKLQIIDMLRPLCQKPNEDTLQVASTSIDISAKVYAIRVDDVHSDSLKLANSMARVSEQVVHPDNENENVSDDEKETTINKPNKKKKKKRTNVSGTKSTVADSSKAHTGSMSKLEPIDFTTRVNADTGTIDNLFTNVMKEGSNNFVLLDNTKTLLDVNDPIVGNKEDLSILGNLSQFEEKIGSINPPFSDFKIDDWDPDQEEKQFGAERSLLTQTQQVVYDDNGIPIPELDGSIHDIFENNDADVDIDHDDADDEDDIQIVQEEMPQLRAGDVAKIIDFRPANESAHTSEYSYNSIVNTRTGKFIDQIWAGPHHWKLKFIHRSTARFSGQKTIETIKEQKRGRKRGQPEMIDLEAEFELDLSKKLVMKKKPASADINKITLPLLDQSCAKLMANIKELMLKPGMCPVEKSLMTENDLDYEVSPYKYENPNDSMYCAQSHEDGDDVNDSNPGFEDHFSEEHIVMERQARLADNLVDNPEMVPKSYVPYSLKAKQMDMKKLKAAVWQALTNNVLNIAPVDSQNIRSKVIPTTFSKMFMSIPDILQEKEKKELSCPLAFFALLHLCNEQNLHLTQMPCYKDFHIRGPQ
ncbi:unnamed protein product [Phaedon cochleariae]|uniref:Condensin complex subunit 2 n=1 Tax=Phaedon cochleariae TaxID=80249 RepID=A0A9N9S8M4_PHACE|nr:unnamed protein product [Phaedon cochleariae]